MRGFGTLQYLDGEEVATKSKTKYVGTFLDNEYEFYGELDEYLPDQDKFNTYKGEFKKSKRDGEGTQTYANDDSYNGSWKNDLISGFGEMTSNSGRTVYKGYYVDGKYDGKGKLTETQSNGVKYYKDGQFEDGKFTKGKVKEIMFGALYEGDVENGKFEGFGKLT